MGTSCSPQPRSQLTGIAGRQWGKICDLAGQFLTQRRRVQQAAPAEEIEKHLSVGATFARRDNRPADRLRQPSVVDECAVLLGPRRSRQNMRCQLAGWRWQQVVNDQKRSLAERGGLFGFDPAAGPWGVAGCNIDRVQPTFRRTAYH